VRTVTRPRYAYFDFDEFCTLVNDDDKADLIDGVIFMASPENLANFRIEMWLLRLLDRYLAKRAIPGEVFGIRIAFRLDRSNAPEPDAAFVCGERLHLVRPNYIDGPPDWAAEVVSPSSIDRDYDDKREQYQHFGVREYWIIDPLTEKITCYRLGRDGKFREARPRQGVVKSSVIPGFWVRPAWFWRTPLPDMDDVVNEILAATNGK
jgi:Uma2 family endonuclease